MALNPQLVQQLKDAVGLYEDANVTIDNQLAQWREEQLRREEQQAVWAEELGGKAWEQSSQRVYQLMHANPDRDAYFQEVNQQMGLDPNEWSVGDMFETYVMKEQQREQEREEAEYQLERRRSAFRRE